MPPEASSSSCGRAAITSRDGVRSCPGVKLSSRRRSAPQFESLLHLLQFSTSTSIKFWGVARVPFAQRPDTAGRGDVIFLDQIGIVQADGGDCAPPPQRTAYFCAAAARATSCACRVFARRCPRSRRRKRRGSVAVPDRVWRKFSAVRSPVSIATCGARERQTIVRRARAHHRRSQPVDADLRVELAEGLVEPGGAAEHCGFAHTIVAPSHGSPDRSARR
jgi:hypothetical protein